MRVSTRVSATAHYLPERFPAVNGPRSPTERRSCGIASVGSMDARNGSPGRSIASQGGGRGGGKRRRPSGEPPPLPRRIGVSGRVWVSLAVTLVAIVMLVLAYPTRFRFFDRWNSAFLRQLVSIR